MFFHSNDLLNSAIFASQTTLHQTHVACILHAHANKSDFSRKPYARLGAAGLR